MIKCCKKQKERLDRKNKKLGGSNMITASLPEYEFVDKG